MKVYAKISSVEKKEIVSENASGKREKKLLYVAKMSTVDGTRVRVTSEEPFSDFTVGSMVGVSFTIAQAKLDTVTKETKETKA